MSITRLSTIWKRQSYKLFIICSIKLKVNSIHPKTVNNRQSLRNRTLKCLSSLRNSSAQLILNKCLLFVKDSHQDLSLPTILSWLLLLLKGFLKTITLIWTFLEQRTSSLPRENNKDKRYKNVTRSLTNKLRI
jgi:hypothetical protein